MRIAHVWRVSGTAIARGTLLAIAAVLCVSSAIGSLPGVSRSVAAESATGVTFRIYATREGLVGSTTSSGHRITPNDHFVALPAASALNKSVRITYKGKSATAPVLDVGPWNIDDDYWNPSDVRHYKGIPQGVPQAQAAVQNGNNGGRSGGGRKVDFPNGIDIGDGTFADLGMTQSDWVEVTFLWLSGDAAPGAASVPTPAAKTAPAPVPASTPKPVGLDLRGMPVLGGSDAPPLDPVRARGDGYTFVAETGHNVPNVIANYWKEKGGVPTLGYPLSELFIRKADGEQHVYQYFERVLIEYLPQSNSVTLAPLGSWFAEVNGPYDTVTAFESTAKKRYVGKTGHSIGGGILQWYAANGDAEMFGAPLSEEMPYTTPDGRNVTAQLFERGRIEMDEDGDVTLGRLGAEWLSQRGWT